MPVEGVERGLQCENLILFALQLPVETFVDAFDEFLGFAVLGSKGIVLDFQFVALDAVASGKLYQLQFLFFAEGLPGEIQGYVAVAAVLDLVVVDVAAGIHPVLADEVLGVGGEVVVAYHYESRPDAGHGDQHHHEGDQAAGAAGGLFVGEALLVEVQILAGQIGGEHYEDGIDGEEVHGPAEEVPVALGDAESCGAQRRHEGGGDRYSGKHCSLFLACLFEDACKSAEERYQHVIYGRGSACLKFGGVCKIQWRQKEEERRCYQAYHHHDEQVAQSVAKQFGIVHSKSEAHANDRAHDRGDQHGADYHRGGVDVQADRSDDDGKCENPYVGAPEIYIVAYVGRSGIDIHLFRYVCGVAPI